MKAYLSKIVTILMSIVIVSATAYGHNKERDNAVSGLYMGKLVEINEAVIVQLQPNGALTMTTAFEEGEIESTVLGTWVGKKQSRNHRRYKTINIDASSFRRGSFLCTGFPDDSCLLTFKGTLNVVSDNRLTGNIAIILTDLTTGNSVEIIVLTLDVSKQ